MGQSRLPISFEFFPPRTGEQKLILESTWQKLAQLQPQYFSVTFGAGGSTRSELTRFFNSGTNTPSLVFTSTTNVFVTDISFDHEHNHNPGFPTIPDYNVALQGDDGGGFVDLGIFNANGLTPGFETTTISGPGFIAANTAYTLRWAVVPGSLCVRHAIWVNR